MFWAVVRKELRNNLVSFRFIVCTLIMVVLAGLATVIATADYHLRRGNYEGQVDKHREDLAAVHVYSFLQPVVVRPPEPLSIVDQGFDARLGNEVRIHLFAVPTTATGGYRGNELMAEYGSLDLTTIVRVVLGLLALLLSFDAVIGEGERGTLRLVFANGISRLALIAGKYLGAFLTLLLPLGASFLLSVALVLRGGVELGDGDWLRLSGLLCSYVGYLSVMLLLGLVVSLFARSAATSLVVALFAWLAVVFLLPQAAALTYDALGTGRNPRDPAEVEAELIAEQDRLLAAEWRRHPLRAAPSAHSSASLETTEHRAVLRRYGSAAYYDALAEYYRHETAIGRRYAERIYAIHQEHVAHRRSRMRWATALAFASPASLLDRIAESFAGTSGDDYDRFLAACRSYRQRLIDYLDRRGAFSSWRWFTDDPPQTHPWPTLFGLTPEEVNEENLEALVGRLREPAIAARMARELEQFRTDPSRLLPVADLPRFAYRSPGSALAVLRAAPAGAALAVLNLLLAVVAGVRFHRYPLDLPS